jgi:hypothetical protein
VTGDLGRRDREKSPHENVGNGKQPPALASMLPFLVLEVIGSIMLARALPWAAVLGGGVLPYFLLINGPIDAPKYRHPMEPVLIVLCALPLAAWFQSKRIERTSQKVSV